MSSNISALKVMEPEFYFTNDSPYWLSRVQWTKNINKDIALVGEGQDRVYGIVEIREPTRIKDIEDIFDNISKSAFQQFRNTSKDIWAYPVVVKRDFSNKPKVIKDGLEDGQRNWIREVSFFRNRIEHYKNMDISSLQSYHDRIHNHYTSSHSDFRLINHHYFIAQQFEENDITHPTLDSLDIQYKKICVGDEFQDIESYSDGVEQLESENYSDVEKVTGLSVLSEKFNKNNILLENLGNWTPETIQQWNQSLSSDQAQKASKIANSLFVELIEKNVRLKTAIQRALSMAVARAKNE